MHELSVSSAVVDTAIRHAAGRRVTGVHLRLGTLRQVVPDSLEFFFGIVARDTLCEGAVLTWDVVPARLRCGPCDREWGIEEPAFRCEVCGSAEVDVVSGQELEVETIEVEEGTPACTA
ncbi:hydrogenase maturation nickel metallochaperone HypA [Paraconexibacter sp.]|uniref:hydrogenase maturation nickel metallochaperone HypA/HybF n=1 Tax=Paraconexibacter sp. TaxID=2949640 RepID=UPI00356B077B